MKFYSNLYTTKYCFRKKNKICRKLKNGKGPLTIFVIAVADGNDILEIYHSSILRQSYFHEKEMLVMGIAESYEKAVELSSKIVIDLYQEMGSFDIKKFSSGKFR